MRLFQEDASDAMPSTLRGAFRRAVLEFLTAPQDTELLDRLLGQLYAERRLQIQADAFALEDLYGRPGDRRHARTRNPAPGTRIWTPHPEPGARTFVHIRFRTAMRSLIPERDVVRRTSRTMGRVTRLADYGVWSPGHLPERAARPDPHGTGDRAPPRARQPRRTPEGR
ncbi:hypothetical protein ACIP88_12730 [Streptomyces uncialis]|uniref:hypothetical protein n=1 Tax=Streptomyces uncialis TaxID=1048205 RepID=UPI0038244DB3